MRCGESSIAREGFFHASHKGLVHGRSRFARRDVAVAEVDDERPVRHQGRVYSLKHPLEQGDGMGPVALGERALARHEILIQCAEELQVRRLVGDERVRPPVQGRDPLPEKQALDQVVRFRQVERRELTARKSSTSASGFVSLPASWRAAASCLPQYRASTKRRLPRSCTSAETGDALAFRATSIALS